MTSTAPLEPATHLALLDEWVEIERQKAALEARVAAVLHQRWMLMESDVREAPFHREAIWRSMVAEFSAAGRIAKGTVERAFTDAHSLHEEFPALRAAFEAGAVRAAHVCEIVRASLVITSAIHEGAVDAGTLDVFEAAALVVAERETPARTRTQVAEIAAALAGETVVEHIARAHEERSVSVRSVGDGLALLQAVLPEHLAFAILDRLTRMANDLRRHPEHRDPVFAVIDPADDASNDPDFVEPEGIFGDLGWCPGDEMPRPTDPQLDPNSTSIIQVPSDERTTDQVRADIFTDLLLAADPSEAHGTGLDNIQGHVQITVAATTLADIDQAPAQLDGHGPLHPDIARAVAGRNTGWTRLFLDPVGLVCETDTYTPTEAMRRFLRARDEHCRFPGCRMPVWRSEIDHNEDWARGGRTATGNLAHFCKAHHVLKHPDVPDAHRWTARQLPDWSVEWTSPDGRTYTDHAPRRVMFVPSGLSGSDDPWAHANALDPAAPAPPPLPAPLPSASREPALATAPF